MNVKIIKTEEAYEKALNRMEEIFNAKEGTLEAEELDLLALVIEKYEDENYSIPDPDPIEAICFAMEQQGIEDKDLAVMINSRSRVSEILNKKRKLNLKQIRVLTEKLFLPADILIKDYKLSLNK